MTPPPIQCLQYALCVYLSVSHQLSNCCCGAAYRNDWYVITTAISFHTCSVRARMLFFCIRTNFNLLTHKHQLTSRPCPSTYSFWHRFTGLPFGGYMFLFWCPNISPCVACRCKNISLQDCVCRHSVSVCTYSFFFSSCCLIH